MKGLARSGVVATLAASLVLLLLLLGPAFGSRDLVTGDTRAFAGARDRLLASSLAHGDGIPLWLPGVWGGAPGLASPELGLAYPPWILLAWLSPERAPSLGIALHLLVAAVGARALARALGATDRGALLAALAFAFGGALVSIHNAPPQVASNAWVPWVAWGVVRATEGAWVPGLAVATLSQLAILLCGDPQLAVPAAIVALAAGGASGGRAPLRASLALAASGALALLLGGVQVVPALAVFDETARAKGLAPDVASYWSLHPPELAGLLVPFFFGARTDPASVWVQAVSPYERSWIETLYVGPLALALALVGLAGLRRRPAARAGLAAVLLLVPFALGRHDPLYRWALGHAPTDRLLGLFRYPAKLAVPATLGLALLVGAGASELDLDRARRWLVRALGVLAALALAGALATLVAGGSLAAAIDGHGAKDVVGASAIGALTPRLVHVAAVAGGALALALSGRRGWARGLVALLVVDLGLALRPALFLVERAPLEPIPRVAPLLERETDHTHEPARVLPAPNASWVTPDDREGGPGERDRAVLEALHGNAGLGRGVLSQKGLLASPPLRQKTLETVVDRAAVPFARGAILRGARYVLTLDGTEGELGGPVTKVGTVGQRVLLRLDEAPPWVSLVGKVRLASKRLEAAELVTSPGFDPRREAVLETKDALACDPELAAQGTAKLDSPFERERFEVAVDAPGAGWLVVREGWGRGWRAWVDGVEAEVVPADVAFRAVHVPALARRVHFAYQAPGLPLGVALSCAGVAAAISLLALGLALGKLRARPRT